MRASLRDYLLFLVERLLLRGAHWRLLVIAEVAGIGEPQERPPYRGAEAVEALAPIHTAQALSYLKATKLRLALLINFNVSVVKDGIKRVVL